MVNLSFRQKQTAVCLFMHYLDKDFVESPDSIGKIMSALRFIFRCNLQSLAIFDDESVRSASTSLRARGRLGCAKNTLVGSTMNVTVDMLNWIRELVMSVSPLNTKNLMISISCDLSFHFGYRPGEVSVRPVISSILYLMMMLSSNVMWYLFLMRLMQNIIKLRN